MTSIPSRRLAATGPTVFPLALGCMGMSGMYGPADEAESIATIHAALDAGITLLDTGDYYGAGHNELLIGRAIRDRRSQALLSVKFGAQRGPDGSWLGIDTRPAAVKNSLAYTLTRLGVDHVDTAYGVLSRGLLSGSRPGSAGDFRAHLPRFAAENRQKNDALVAALRQLAAERGATASQIAIAWVLAKGDFIVPVIGARTREQLTEALGALALTLSPEDTARIEQAVPASAVAGTRYDQHQMRVLDSER